MVYVLSITPEGGEEGRERGKEEGREEPRKEGKKEDFDILIQLLRLVETSDSPLDNYGHII